jgi:hypothetical protein
MAGREGKSITRKEGHDEEDDDDDGGGGMSSEDKPVLPGSNQGQSAISGETLW